MFEKFKNDSKNKFYPVEDYKIKEVEKVLNINLPKELKQFYKEVGYGFFYSHSGCYFNLLMAPTTAKNFRLRQNEFEFYPNLEIYEPYEKNRLIFFQACEVTFFSIELNDKDKQRIFNYNEPIADSLLEFCELISKDEKFCLHI